MISVIKSLGAALFVLAITGPCENAVARKLTAAQVAACTRTLHIVTTDDHPLGMIWGQSAGRCHTQIRNGFPVPDPGCTPGATNSTVTLDVLKSPKFKTGCVRDHATSAHQKITTYGWYAVTKPAHNTGANQICELDHLVSLELGGADTLDNIWPQCGPDGARGLKRFFKQKDRVEGYLAAQVRANAIGLEVAQRGIAQDWTQYLNDANNWAASKAGHKTKKKKVTPRTRLPRQH